MAGERDIMAFSCPTTEVYGNFMSATHDEEISMGQVAIRHVPLLLAEKC